MEEENDHVSLMEGKDIGAQPRMESSRSFLLMHTDLDEDTTLPDVHAYRSLHYADEADKVNEFRFLCKRAKVFVTDLYSHRSLSRATPLVRSDMPDEMKKKLHRTIYEVYRPEVKKLFDVRAFSNEAVDLFCTTVKELISVRTVPSVQIIHAMCELIDQFAVIDTIMDTKACFTNDFSYFKRSLPTVRGMPDLTEEVPEENDCQQVEDLLKGRQFILTSLRNDLEKYAGYEKVMAQMLNHCIEELDGMRHILPEEKHALLRVCVYGVTLLDRKDTKEQKFILKKNLKLYRFTNYFKMYPVIPVFGDITLNVSVVLKTNCSHFSENWVNLDNVSMRKTYLIVNNIDVFRSLYTMYMSRFVQEANRLEKIPDGERQLMTFEELMPVFELVVEGLQLLCRMSSAIKEQAAFKYVFAVDPKELPEDERIKATVYEQVVRYNYSPEEQLVLVEMIGLVKSLASLMIEREPIFLPIIMIFVQKDIQTLIQCLVPEMQFHIKKKQHQDSDVSRLIDSLKSVGDDEYSHLHGAGLSKKGKVLLADGSKPDVKVRRVLPSRSRLHMLWVICENILAQVGLQKMLHVTSTTKSITSAQAKSLKAWYDRSCFYRSVLSIANAAIETSDLSFLWLREFYLEFVKAVQFPMDFSLPWILMKEVLEPHGKRITNVSVPWIEMIFYPIMIYNDVANSSLMLFKKQHLYDEIEVEMNLVFDQMMFKLTEAIYTHAKVQASSILLNKNYREQVQRMKSKLLLGTPKSRFEGIFDQKFVQILGRNVSISKLLIERLNDFFRRNVDVAISRFEAHDLTSVIELRSLMSVIQLTHQILDECFVGQLDSFELIFREINEDVAVVSMTNRIVWHIVREIMNDFSVNFVHNLTSRMFTRSEKMIEDASVSDSKRPAPLSSGPIFTYGSRTMDGVFRSVLAPYRHFFGVPHFEAIVRLIGRSGTTMLIDLVSAVTAGIMRDELYPYVEALQDAMPSRINLPSFELGFEPCFAFYCQVLMDLITYVQSNHGPFHVFRKVGNCVMFARNLDFASSASVDVPQSFFSDACQHIKSSGQVMESLSCESMFPDVLQKLKNDAVDPFLEILAENSPSVSISNCQTVGKDFYHVFSLLQFVFSLKMEENMTLFGHSFSIGGCTLLHLLNQKARFDLFDFSYHVLNAEMIGEARASTSKSKTIKDFMLGSPQYFLTSARIVRQINNDIFGMLQRYYSTAPLSLYVEMHHTLFETPLSIKESSVIPRKNIPKFVAEQKALGEPEFEPTVSEGEGPASDSSHAPHTAQSSSTVESSGAPPPPPPPSGSDVPPPPPPPPPPLSS
eukprot:TRINITY_DN1183_c1_g1_i1.p1 TRINITY_DN1183_c1_g1~~TRINITY_DN1183_c1_g1_i1.p1  ORF type:complete len:1309 (+),score=317.31 TRINITY_DN1183_c1_g1_i1:160-4086(+)